MCLSLSRGLVRTLEITTQLIPLKQHCKWLRGGGGNEHMVLETALKCVLRLFSLGRGGEGYLGLTQKKQR